MMESGREAGGGNGIGSSSISYSDKRKKERERNGQCTKREAPPPLQPARWADGKE